MTKEMILGTWTLISYEMTSVESQKVIYPYGENPIGILIYTTKDVSVHIMRAGRSPKDNLLDEKIEAAENYGGYVGSYEIKGDTIIHHLDVCGFLSFFKTPQIRRFHLSNDRLTLECSSFYKEIGKEVNSQLIWKRTHR